MNQHNYFVLHDNEAGWVSQCNCCGEIQLSLGTVLMHMPVKEFHPFVKSFMQVMNCPNKKKAVDHPCMEAEQVIIQTPIQNLHLSFTEREYLKLTVLLDMASLMLETQNLLKQ